MIVDLTPPEKQAIATTMRGMTWGGTPEILLAQVSLHEKLGLAAFGGDGVPAVESKAVELSTNETTILVAVCSAKGQDQDTALMSAAVLRRVLAPQQKSTAGGGA